MLESRVLRNINEFNIPGLDNGYEAMYFGVNLILMDYRLTFDMTMQEAMTLKP